MKDQQEPRSATAPRDACQEKHREKPIEFAPAGIDETSQQNRDLDSSAIEASSRKEKDR